MFLGCAGHEGQEHSLPEMKAGEPEAILEAVWRGRFQCSHFFSASLVDPPTLQGEYESLLTLEGLQSTVSQCLQKLQLLQEGETVPVSVVRCERGPLPSVCRTLDQGHFAPGYLYGIGELNSLVANKSVVPVCHLLCVQERLGALNCSCSSSGLGRGQCRPQLRVP